MQTYGIARRGGGAAESVPLPRGTVAHANHGKRTRTSPFPPLDPEEANRVLVPSARLAAATPARRKTSTRTTTPTTPAAPTRSNGPGRGSMPAEFDADKARALLEMRTPRKDIARLLGVSDFRLREFAILEGFPTKQGSPSSRRKELPDAVQDFLDGMNSSQIARKHGVDRKTVVAHLAREGYHYDAETIARRTHWRPNPDAAPPHDGNTHDD